MKYSEATALRVCETIFNSGCRFLHINKTLASAAIPLLFGTEPERCSKHILFSRRQFCNLSDSSCRLKNIVLHHLNIAVYLGFGQHKSLLLIF